MSKFKKIDREFTLSDSSLNSYSYRLLTSGYLMDEFKKNPIGYYMHGETKDFPREDGVLVKWEDLRIEGDVVKGKPCINLMHPRGQRTIDEIESGFLNAASFGNMRVLEISSDPADYLPGQTGLSASKWYNRECSLVDQPGNYNATASDLYDENDLPINLADFTTQKFTMNKIVLTPAQLAAFPNLKADPTQEDVNLAFADLVAKAGKVDTLITELSTAKTDKETAVIALQSLKDSTIATEVENLVAIGVNEKRFTAEAGTALQAQFAGKPVELKALIATFQPFTSIIKDLGKGAEALLTKSWDELDKGGLLPALKAADEPAFFQKYESKFNKKHADDKA